MTAQYLPASERIVILSRRLDNLKNGSGEYEVRNRAIAIKQAQLALATAIREMGN